MTTAHVNRAKQRIAEQITGHVDATVYNDPRGSRILAHPGSSVLRGDARRKRTGRPHKFLPRLFPQPSTLWMARSARQGTQIAAVGRPAATLPCRRMRKNWCRGVALDPVPARTILVASVPASPPSIRAYLHASIGRGCRWKLAAFSRRDRFCEADWPCLSPRLAA